VLKPQNYSTTPAIKAWRPPVPEPLPPAPLLGPKELLALGLLIGGQVWAWLNGRPKTTKDLVPIEGLSASGDKAPANNTTPGTLTIQHPGLTYTGKQDCTGPSFTVSSSSATFTINNAISWSVETNPASQCGTRDLVVRVKRLNQADQVVTILGTNFPNGVGVNAINVALSFSWTGTGAVPWSWPQEQLPAPDGFTVPEIKPDVAAPVQPPPLPTPAPATMPQVEPEVQPEVAPVAPGPSTIPLPQIAPTSTVATPQQIPGAVTVQNGALPTPAPAPVPTTDPGSIVPWPGAAPIPGTGPAPAPTMDGIAQELGRIERKLEVMNTPTAPGNLVDQIGNLQDLIGPIVELILAATSGTVYTLDSPCEVDGDGKRLPAVEVEAPGGLTQFGAILNRIDALAELLQVHKDLKQPNCRGADVPVSGEFVTVNFEQID
jgi:hypothetical protein